MLTALWLALGALFGWGFWILTGMYGRAQKRVLANGLVIAAIIYVGFALRTGLSAWLLYECLGIALFGVFAWLGVRRSPSWLAFGWALHPAWDAGLHLHGYGASFAPEWYVLACISFDLLVGALIYQRRDQL